VSIFFREMPQFFSKACVLLTWVWLACLALPAAAITPMDLGTCWNYLQQPCNCGVCSWFYQLNPPCSSQNLTMCVRLGYYTGGPRQDQCCSPNVAKMVIVAVVVVSIVACWCCLIAAIMKLKRMQRRKRQRGALADVDNILGVPDGSVSYQPGRFTSDYQFGAPYDPNFPRSSTDGGSAINQLDADTAFVAPMKPDTSVFRTDDRRDPDLS